MIGTAETATYNLGVVLQETGLNPDTLRAWERRYGLPQPQRSEGGHRLYSQRDIAIVKWLMARQAEKMSISQAVKLWRGLEEEGQDPLRVAARLAAARSTIKPGTNSVGLLADVRQAWVRACKEFNEREAEAILSQAFALFTAEAVCTEVLIGGLAELGAGWYDGEVIVQQEHFATELARRRLEALIQATPPSTRADRILVAAPAGEEHDVILLLLVLLLRRRSLDVIHLGANMPVEHLVSVVASTKSDMVVSAAQRLPTAASMQQMAQALAMKQVPLLYGGRIFNLVPRLRRQIAGFFIGEAVEKVTQVVEEHLASPQPVSPLAPVAEVYRQALDHFQAQLPLIEGEVLAVLGTRISEDHLSVANLNIAQDIEAALSLGDMGLMGNEIEWLEGLLANHQLPREQLQRYLAVYRQVSSRYLDDRARPVTQWLKQIDQPIR